MSVMYNPVHPGEFIRVTYMEPFSLSCRYLATKLDVSPSTLNRVLKAQSGISPEMALRLSKALGRSPESWLAMQDTYDLWHAEKQLSLDKVQKLEFPPQLTRSV
ncbi:MAG: HigA family addiction module antidote protein [Idiomarina sp.]|nr:HigA family addiction module antidote protein [Idiomarina sp.]